MPTKLQIIHELAEKQAGDFSNRESWISFLETAARMYKYPFHEQIMIFTQRPEASACASIELWNRLKRHVKRGAKGIALIDDSGSRPGLKYVFDINDTEGLNENVRKPFIWELKPEHESAVISYLANRYDCSDGYLPDMLRNIAERLSYDFYEDNFRDIRYCVSNSFLEEYDDLNLESAFTEALTVSLTYSLMHRCGIDAGGLFDAEDFQFINDFNTKETVYALGTAISSLSEQVLRDIEKAVKNYELQIKTERTAESGKFEIQPERELPDAANIADGGNETTVEQVRTDEEKLPQTAPPDTVQHNAFVGETVPAPVRNGQDSERTAGTYDVGTVTEQPAAGQSGESVGMGTAHEQPEKQGGGNNYERIDLQLTQPPPPVLIKNENIVPSVQKSETDGVSFSELFAGSVISFEAVDTLLRQGSNNRGGLKRVAAYYMKKKSPAECTEFLKNEYKKGGRGVKIGGKQTSLWFNETGMTFGDGATAIYARDSVHLTWEQVENRIREQINEGQYMPQSELDKALDFERKEVSESLLFLNRDVEDGHRFLSEEDNIGGFPEMEERLSEKLKKPEQLDKIINGLKDFYKAYEKEPSILRFRYLYKPQLLQRLYDLRIEPLKLTANDISKTEYTRFITEDEIDAFFTRGGNIESSKYRILSFFLKNSSAKERENVIKDEYNNSGSSHALSGADDSDYNGFHGAITLSRGEYGKTKIEVKIKWSEAVKRINKLIYEGHYMNQKELDLIPLYEKDELARSLISFFHNVPEDMYRPYPVTTDYYESKKILSGILDSPDKSAELLIKIKPIYEATHPDDRNYNSRKKAYENLTEYQNKAFA